MSSVGGCGKECCEIFVNVVKHLKGCGKNVVKECCGFTTNVC